MPCDRPDRVRGNRERNPLPFPIALDEQGEIARTFDATRDPADVLIDKRGRIVQR